MMCPTCNVEMLPSEEGKAKCPNCNNEKELAKEETPAAEAPAEGGDAAPEAPQPEADQS